ncbi:hypothetical protein HYV89_02625 [Candidatus Woesearchaeota archaeon]|nr:hypothetical protein [Candidatus Woesearchaeota archaeon]
MFKWFTKKWAKEEIEDALRKLNFHISTSFLNVKKDMDQLTSHHSRHGDKLKSLEQRLGFLERQILAIVSSKDHRPSQEKRQVPSSEALQLMSPPQNTILDELTDTQKGLLIEIYRHQSEMNTPLTIKYLAEALYPGRYEQVRTTLIEYLDTLSSYGLIKKVRKKRLIYVHTTEKGASIVKNYLKDKGKKKQRID